MGWEYKVGAFILNKCHLRRLLCKESAADDAVGVLYPREDRNKILAEIWGKRAVLTVVLLILAGVIWIICLTESPEDSILTDGYSVTRQEEDSTLSLEVTGDDGTEQWQEEMSVDVKVREFTDREKEELEANVKSYVDKTLPGENKSLQQISRPLCFVKQVPDTGVALEWTYDEDYFKDSGKLKASQIPKEGADTEIMLEAGWRNWKKTFYFMVHLEPAVFSKREQQVREVRKALKEAVKRQSAQETVRLPQKVQETNVTYQTMGQEKNYTPVFVVLGLCLALPFFWREQQRAGLQKREEQMLRDHPGFVNKIMLLLSAGLTLRKCVERLAAEYERDRGDGGELRYVYEEVCIMQQEMNDGISEVKAMERFGQRCRLLPYLRFSSIVTQNLKKGAEGIICILEQESLEALQQRKDRALQLGEKAGTKLLFPMMLMLGLVMGIIMIPAFMTM